jgi:acyl carrier protein
MDRSAYTDTASVPAGTPTEELLVTFWQDILGVAPVGTADNFLELGGTSMLAVHLVARLEKQTGVRIAAEDVLEAPTLAALAQEIDHTRTRGEA